MDRKVACNWYMAVSFLLKKGKNPTKLQNQTNEKNGYSDISLNSPYALASFSLVSDGQMVRELCNRTKEKLPYGSFSFVSFIET